MKTAVESWMPQIAPGVEFEAFDLGSKSQFMKKVGNRLSGYRYAIQRGDRVAVVLLRDRDEEDCGAVVADLDAAVKRAGLRRASVGRSIDGDVLPRLADEMLEAWFFGDGNALHEAFPKLSPMLTHRAAYRRPDVIRDPARRLASELAKCGYYPQGMPKDEVARLVAPKMAVDANTSPSFAVFRDGVRFLAQTAQKQEN